MKITELNEAKANKWLDTKIKDSVHGILTRRELLSREMVGTSKTVQEYSTNKAKTSYWLEMNWCGEFYSKKCPKYVWDCLVAAKI